MPVYVALAFGLGSGVFGLIRLLRRMLYLKLAVILENLRAALDLKAKDSSIITAFPKSEWIKSMANLVKRARTQIEDISKWQWLDRGAIASIMRSLRSSEFRFEVFMRECRGWEEQEDKSPWDEKMFESYFLEMVALLREGAKSLRDSATTEVVWATAGFALGSLVVGLLALWI